MKQRFLVSRLSSLGDVVCSLPVATAIKKQFPESEVVWAVDPRFSGIVECCTAVDSVLKVKPGFSPSSWPKFENPKFDAALDLQGLFKSAIVVAKAKAEKKLGYHWQREGAQFFTQAVMPDPSSFHIVDQYVDVVRALGVDVDAAEFSMSPQEEDLTAMRELLQKNGLQDGFVVMNPGAGWITKRWQPESFAAVIDSLESEGLQTVLIGGKAEADRTAADEVKQACKTEPIDLGGQTSVRELVALIGLCKAHLGGDTGSTHLAAALGVPAIGLYSITRPKRSCPYGQVERCHYHPESLACIEPQAVLQTILEAVA